ncbi:hypothetical protein BC628DRAFT_1418151 [Trametes gibbosa]|nr:hypothetical protein BC628DRAFT_1418151 [Trametes gibbosa]
MYAFSAIIAMLALLALALGTRTSVASPANLDTRDDPTGVPGHSHITSSPRTAAAW